MNQPELGKKISELRLLKGLTQNELAELCNVSLRTIQRIELAEVTPRSFTIKTIFSVLDYDFYNSNAPIVNGKTSSSVYWIKDLFNLKKNTMKKLSFLSIILLFATVLLTRNESQAQNINGWFKTGSKAKSYEIGLNSSESKTGKKCAYIKSIKRKIKGFGTIMQTCDAKNYLGKQIKMTGYVKTENVENWSGMWLRVDSKYGGKYLSFDNMHDRPIKGDTDWMKCEIILNVPKESSTLNFGILLNGTGEVYFDRISFEILGDITETTVRRKIPEKPANIDFEE
ncbi:helix-turn-helix domain-containing protein [Flavobacterium sp. H122]|uniref:helix-turn-helix domain-containing protein n=1 Tax=Flavobacterium sp. H122 TaxID=2529860 RepID=UPI0010AAC276|nr:helix-turn-helix transcriptional regulator [Flavobacterium sp. H122]